MRSPHETLREEHDHIRWLFERFDETEGIEERKQIAKEILIAFEAHTALEEELLYPALRDVGHDTFALECGQEEHRAAQMQGRELSLMEPGDDDYAAKLRVFRDIVERHFASEEYGILAGAAAMDREWMEVNGKRMEERRETLRYDAAQNVRGGVAGQAQKVMEQGRESFSP